MSRLGDVPFSGLAYAGDGDLTFSTQTWCRVQFWNIQDVDLDAIRLGRDLSTSSDSLFIFNPGRSMS